VDVKASFGSSTTLAESAVDGAPGDVLATADETSMRVAQDGGVVTDPTEFATNALVLVVPKDNPAGIKSLDDVPGTDWVRCADDVPCGRVAQAVLADNEFTDEAASLEVDVKAVLSKVTSGEADAGFVYATDAQAAGNNVIAFNVPKSDQELTSYFVARLDQTEDADLAKEWIELMESATGREVLARARFGTP
ncbi:MAG: molybdate ABC transporter substrate-binding protein, partial [Nocardioides sp.]|nr:molybdate ABC transporter substrate-binding protein [Nocardioides sp.]